MQQKSPRAKPPPSSTGAEIRWLFLFLSIFIVITYCMLRFVVPLHFNDRIAVMVSAIISGVMWIIVRGASIKRA